MQWATKRKSMQPKSAKTMRRESKDMGLLLSLLLAAAAAATAARVEVEVEEEEASAASAEAPAVSAVAVFLFLSAAGSTPLSPTGSADEPRNCLMMCEMAIEASTTTIGVSVSIRRTMTPAKYTELTAYRITKTRALLTRLMRKYSPAGNSAARMCKSCGGGGGGGVGGVRKGSREKFGNGGKRPTMKNDVQVVGWCSETEAMIGIWILA